MNLELSPIRCTVRAGAQPGLGFSLESEFSLGFRPQPGIGVQPESGFGRDQGSGLPSSPSCSSTSPPPGPLARLPQKAMPATQCPPCGPQDAGRSGKAPQMGPDPYL